MLFLILFFSIRFFSSFSWLSVQYTLTSKPNAILCVEFFQQKIIVNGCELVWSEFSFLNFLWFVVGFFFLFVFCFVLKFLHMKYPWPLFHSVTLLLFNREQQQQKKREKHEWKINLFINKFNYFCVVVAVQWEEYKEWERKKNERKINERVQLAKEILYIKIYRCKYDIKSPDWIVSMNASNGVLFSLTLSTHSEM